MEGLESVSFQLLFVCNVPGHLSCAEIKLRVQEKLFSQLFLIEANALQLCAIFLFGMKMVKKK